MTMLRNSRVDFIFYLGSAVAGLLGAFTLIAFVEVSAHAQQDHPDFSGNWKLNVSGSHIKDSKLEAELARLTISQKEPAITLAESDGHAVECTTAGKECETKVSKVSFWYNGSKLVEMEYQGRAGHVRKRRLSLSADGKTLQMEVIPITPAGETSMLAFDKTQ